MTLRRLIVCRNGTKAMVYGWGSRVILPGGQVIEGRPQGTPAQAETAAELGYGDDVEQMIRDHDPLHALTACWLGLSVSYGMAVAAGLAEEDAVSRAEEGAVLALQRLLRLAGRPIP